MSRVKHAFFRQLVFRAFLSAIAFPNPNATECDLEYMGLDIGKNLAQSFLTAILSIKKL
jgi:hypothetical protein